MMIDRFKAQDAYHYALAAAGGVVDSHYSSFTMARSRDAEGRSRTALLKLARKRAREAGLTPPTASSLADAERLARAILNDALAKGVDAFTGQVVEREAAAPIEIHACPILWRVVQKHPRVAGERKHWVTIYAVVAQSNVEAIDKVRGSFRAEENRLGEWTAASEIDGFVKVAGFRGAD